MTSTKVGDDAAARGDAALRLVAIHVAKASRLPMRAVDAVEAEAGRGLVGDRYHGTRHRHVTVQSLEELAEAADRHGAPIDPGATRRNLTLSSGRLPRRAGARLRVGDALLEVVRDAAPCKLLEDALGRDARLALSRRAGVVCRLLEGGRLRVGDAVEILVMLALGLALVAGLARPVAAAADEVPSAGARDVEVMLVTGSYAPRPAATIPNATTVLEGDALDDTISVSLDDALRFVPGLQVTRQGGRGGRGELLLRGLDPNHVVVLVDGVRLNDPTNSRGGSFDPTTLSLADIERVEVVRGPLSAVHGSDALAGAINVVTRRADPDQAPTSHVRARGGRFHQAQAQGRASTGLGGVAGLSLGAAIDTFRDPESDGGYDGASLKATLAGTLPGAVELEGFTRIHQSSARGYPDSSGGGELAFSDAVEDRNVREILFGAALRRTFADHTTVSFRASRASRREEVDAPRIVPQASPTLPDVPATRTGDEYERWEITGQLETDLPARELAGLSQESRLVVGSNVIWEDGESDAFFLDLFGPGSGYAALPWSDNRRTIGAFGTLEHEIAERVVLSGSLRYDAVRGEKDRLSPAAGLSIDVPGTPLTLFGSYGEGFKLPSFYARRNPLVGDPDLLTETSRGWEIGLRGRFEDAGLRFEVTWFDLRVKELIDFDDTGFALVNRERLVSRGVELEIGWRPRDWVDLRVGGTWNDTDFVGGSSAEPEGRPEWRGFLEFEVRPCPSITATVRLLGVSRVDASAYRIAPRAERLAGYERLDLGATWTVREGLDLFVEIQNATNATPREAIGFESPGIAPRAGLTLRL